MSQIRTIKCLIIVAFLIFGSHLVSFGQSSLDGMKYQAIIRDASGNVVGNKIIKIKFTIYRKGQSPEYEETHNSVSTNQLGLINLEIGLGDPQTGDFKTVKWDLGQQSPFYILVEMDLGSGFTQFGESKLLTVPYAQYSKFAETARNVDDADADSTNEIQDLQLTGNDLTITIKGTPTIINLAPYLDNTDAQVLSYNSTTDSLELTNGGRVDMSRYALDQDLKDHLAKYQIDSNKFQTQISRNQDSIAFLKVRLKQLNDSMSVAYDTLGVHNTRINNNGAAINGLDSRIVADSIKLNATNAQVTGLNTRIVADSNRLVTTNKLVDSLDSRIVSDSIRLNQTQADITGLDTRITNDSNRLNPIEAAAYKDTSSSNEAISSLTISNDSLVITEGGITTNKVDLSSYTTATPGLDSVLAAGNDGANQDISNVKSLVIGGTASEAHKATIIDSTQATTGYEQALKVRSNGTATTGVTQSAVYGDIAGTKGENIGVDGTSSGNSSGTNTGTGGYARNGTNNRGVHGVADSANISIGVHAQADKGKSQNLGVFGSATNGDTLNTGVYGQASGSSQINHGVQGQVTDANTTAGNRGVMGSVDGKGKWNEGVAGFSNGTNTTSNTGVLGRAFNSTGENSGVIGRTSTKTAGNNYGVTGYADSASNTIAVRGIANGGASSSLVYGVYGQVGSGGTIKRGVVGVLSGAVDGNDAAVYGIANGTGKNIGLYGRATFSNSSDTSIAFYGDAANAAVNISGWFKRGEVYVDDTLHIRYGAQNNYVLTSDANGKAEWKPAGANNDNDSTNELITSFILDGSDLRIIEAGDTSRLSLLGYVDTASFNSYKLLAAGNLADSVTSLRTIDSALNIYRVLDSIQFTNAIDILKLGAYKDSSSTNEILSSITMLNDTTFTFNENGSTKTLSIGALGTKVYTNRDSIQTLNSNITTLESAVNAGAYKDSSSSNEIQVLSISSDSIYLSNGGFVVLPATATNNDNDSTNEYVDSLNFAGNKLYLSQSNGGKIDSTDLSSLDQSSAITSLNSALGGTQDSVSAIYDSLAVHKTSIGTNASSISTNTSGISTNASNITTNSTGITTNATNITTLQGGAYKDSSATNEIQALSISSDTIYLSNGGFAVLPANAVNNDNDSTNELNTSVALSGTNLNVVDGGGTKTADLSSLEESQAIIDSAAAIRADIPTVAANNDNDSTNELNTSVALSGTDLNVVDGGGTKTADLSSLEESQAIIDSAAAIRADIPTVAANNDNDSTNELNTSVALSGTNLNVVDGGGTKTADLSSLEESQAIIDSAAALRSAISSSTYTTKGIDSVLAAGSNAAGDSITNLGAVRIGAATTNKSSLSITSSDDFSIDIANSSGTGSERKGVFSVVSGSNTTANFGLYGSSEGSTLNNYAVFGISNANNSSTKYGTYGEATGSLGKKYGVFGKASGGAASGNFAGYFDAGNVHIKNQLGIGTETPARQLDVVGDAFMDSLWTDSLVIGSGSNQFGIGSTSGSNGQVLTLNNGVANWSTALNTEDDSTRISLNSGKVLVSSLDTSIVFEKAGTETFKFYENHIKTSSGNVYVGFSAGNNDDRTSSSVGNTGVGHGALQTITTGTLNSSFGWLSLRNNNASGNSAFGYSSLQENTTGGGNVALGAYSLYLNKTGNNNTAIGNGAGQNNLGKGNVFIGYSAASLDTLADNTLYIENSNSSSPLIWGDFTNDTLKFNADVIVRDGFYLDQSNAAVNKVLTSDANGKATWQSLSSNDSTKIEDGLTKAYVKVADSSINFAVNGVDYYQFYKNRLVMNAGNNNVAVGGGNVFNNNTGSDNTAFGNGVLGASSSGSFNTGVGTLALGSNTSGAGNTGIGRYALRVNTTGSSNTALGFGAIAKNTTGSNNVGLGTNALAFLISGSNNVALGKEAGRNALGSRNLFLGNGSGQFETGSDRLYIANSSSKSLIYGEFDNDSLRINGNVLVGGNLTLDTANAVAGKVLTSDANGKASWQTLSSSTNDTTQIADVDNNTKVSVSTTTDNIDFIQQDTNFFRMNRGNLEVLNTGSSVFMGENAGDKDDYSDNRNVFIGYSAGQAVTKGDNNIYLGYDAGRNNITGATNIFMGTFSGKDATASNNIGIGFNTLSKASGASNVVVGPSSASAVTSGTKNTGLGSNNFSSLSSGEGNVALGYGAALSISTQHYNVAVGMDAYKAGTGSRNIVIGKEASKLNAGNNNTIMGTEAIELATSGSSNVIMGYRAGYNAGTINNNVLIGYQAGQSSTSSSLSNNVFIGYQSGYLNKGINNLFLGYQAGYNETGSNKLYIANSNTKSLIYGEFDNDSLRINGNVLVGGNLTLDTSNAVTGKVLTSDANGKATWQTVTAGSIIQDADGNTSVDAEKNSNEDILRFTTNGTERMTIGKTGNVTTTGNLIVGSLLYADNINGTGDIRFYQAIFPNANGTEDLGRTGNRWSTIYGKALDLSDAASVKNLTVTDGSPSAGKVLTAVDGTGLATWSSISADTSLVLANTGRTSFSYFNADTFRMFTSNREYFTLKNGRLGINMPNPTARLCLWDTVSSSGGKVGINAQVHSINSQDTAIGVKTYLTGDATNKYGVYADVYGGPPSAKYYALWGRSNGLGNNGDFYGSYNVAEGTGTFSEYWGVYAKANGTSASATNYGLWATASGGTDNFAGYFDAGNVQVNNKMVVGGSFGNSYDSSLNVLGGIKTDYLRIYKGAGLGKVLVSDADGGAAWAAVTTIDTLVCPAGFEKANASFCIEKAERAAATWYVAVETCGNADAELATYTDWYFGAKTLTLTDETDDAEWVSNISQNNMMTVGNGAITTRAFKDPTLTAPYRCVYRKQ